MGRRQPSRGTKALQPYRGVCNTVSWFLQKKMAEAKVVVIKLLLLQLLLRRLSRHILDEPRPYNTAIPMHTAYAHPLHISFLVKHSLVC